MATLIEWRNGGLPGGWNTAGDVSIDTSRSGFAVAMLNTSQSYFRAPALTSAVDAFTCRFYLHMPTTFTYANQWSIFSCFQNANNTGHVAGVALSGASDPQRLRWLIDQPATSVNTSLLGGFEPGEVVRVEMQVDTVANTLFTGFFSRKTNRVNGTKNPWLTSQSIYGPALRFLFGHAGSGVSGHQPIGISRIKVVDSVGSWVGRDESDTLPLPPVPVTVIL